MGGEGLTSQEDSGFSQMLGEATLAAIRSSQSELHGWGSGRRNPPGSSPPLAPGSYSDQSNLPEANPIREETGPETCDEMVYHSN